MASIRKLTWTTERGKRTTKYQLSYYDRDGNRVRKNFAHKDDADRERIRVEGQLEAGTHITDRNSRTVLQACRAWLDHVEDLVKVGKRERQTHRPYRNHVDLVIAKHDIASVKLSRLTTPTCQLFVDHLEKSVSRARLRKVLRSLRMALNFAARRGWIAGNPAAQAKADTIDRAKEEVEIPEKAELRALLLAASVFDETGYAEAFVTTKLFSGLRISELRGLPKARGLHLFDNTGPKIRVLQRADERGRIGPPKSRTSRRTVPVGPATVHALQRWLPNVPAGDFGLVFPNGAGNVESYANIYHRVWVPLCIVAGVVKNPSARKSKQRPKYGPHSLRHAYASMLIEQGLSPKQVQHRMGHAGLQMTMDLYGHLWPDPDADRRSAQATERIIFGAR